MTPQEIKELKNNALALRNLASKVLDIVERAEKQAPRSRTMSRKSITEVDLIERIMTGRKKPVLAYKKSK